MLLETLELAEQGALRPVPQREEDSTYAKMLTRDLGRLDFSWEAEKIERYIRGLNSWPSAFTALRGRTLKLWRAEVTDTETGEEPGTVVSVEKDGFTVQTGKGCLIIRELQLEGKKRMSAADFLRGIKLEKGDMLCI